MDGASTFPETVDEEGRAVLPEEEGVTLSSLGIIFYLPTFFELTRPFAFFSLPCCELLTTKSFSARSDQAPAPTPRLNSGFSLT